jgi:hypothetical protein
VLIELDRQGVDLALQLGQATGQPVTLLAKGLGQRDHRLDESTLAILDRWDGVHLVTSAKRVGGVDANRMPRRAAPGTRIWRNAASPA